MIGTLAGVLAFKSPPHLLLEVGGVGYELEAPMSTFYTLPAIGERTRLLTHLVVREDAHVLYGFASHEERTLFRNLLKVSGVGPRIALAILSGGTSSTFARAVREHDAAALTRIPGVGRKIAERLIVEMRDRIDVSELTSGPATESGAVARGAEAEAYGALVSLGYKPGEATRLIKSIGESVDLSTEELIRRALQSAVRT
ncbi:MAG TPA: Holliday junction branch migration protein RuvA [Steroidobacteraceae bacterium]|jgi:Holliday junction DNA helicase RuvA